MDKAELLAPVGKMENAIAAIENGADALFIGGKNFNARASATNFTQEELEEIIDYAKLRGVKIYITVNILIKENEREELYHYLKYLESIGVDAIIVQDLGIARMARKYFPKLRLHASTQMSAHSIADVLFLQSLGFKRVVLAREMQLSEIEEIRKHCDVELEGFVHGALCYSYSGQCLMSSLIGGRSGNRGRCAQPCRMRYALREDGRLLEASSYLLSLKDICTLEFLPQLLETGIHSLKIEGRMKSPEYVASVVGIYRKYLDQISEAKPFKVDPSDLECLKSIFNRGGFSKGYYYQRGNREMLTPNSPRHIGVKVGEVLGYNRKANLATIKIMQELHPGDGLEIIRQGKDSVGTGITKLITAGSIIKCSFDKAIDKGSEVYLTKNHELLKKMKATYNRPQRKRPIEMHIIGRIGEPLKITCGCNKGTVSYEGPILQRAENNPMTTEKAQKQLTKLGNTAFCAVQVEMEWPEDCYIGISDLNEARREVVLLLEKLILKKGEQVCPNQYPNEVVADQQEAGYTAHVTTLEQLEAVLEFKEIKAIYWEWHYDEIAAKKALEQCQKQGVAFYLALPSIMKDNVYEQYKEEWDRWQHTALTGFLVRTMGQFHSLKSLGKSIRVDYNLNIANSESASLWQEMGAEAVTVSVEASETELSGLAGKKERIVYGYLPVMTSSQCVLRGTPSCQKGKKQKHNFELEDRKGSSWQVQTDCKACVMQLISYEPLALKYKVTSTGIAARFQFTSETGTQVSHILSSYLGYHHDKIEGIAFKSVL